MRGFHWTPQRVATVAVAGAVAGGVLLAGAVVAQTPSPSPSPAPGTTPSASPRPKLGGFAARLAQALGIPQADVERALQQTGPHGPWADGDHGRRFVDALAPAASQLGVTPQQLADALQAARRSLREQRTPGQGGLRTGLRPDRTALYNAVAQQLGRGITGAQVEAALRSLRLAQGNRPTREEIQARIDQRLQQLAQALGVSVERLQEALRSIGGPRRGGR